MLSAHSSVDNVRAALGAGASAFLVKPFHRDKLQGLLLQFAKERLAGSA
jgi:response regulator of citrate/malate metabolism